MVRSGHLITLIKCLKGHKSLEPLCNVKIKMSLSDLLSCSGQLKTHVIFVHGKVVFGFQFLDTGESYYRMYTLCNVSWDKMLTKKSFRVKDGEAADELKAKIEECSGK